MARALGCAIGATRRSESTGAMPSLSTKCDGINSVGSDFSSSGARPGFLRASARTSVCKPRETFPMRFLRSRLRWRSARWAARARWRRAVGDGGNRVVRVRLLGTPSGAGELAGVRWRGKESPPNVARPAQSRSRTASMRDEELVKRQLLPAVVIDEATERRRRGRS